MRKYSVVLLFCILTSSMYAQDKWTLRQCIDHAMKYNLQIRQKIIDKESAEIQLHTARMSRLPDLNAGMSQNFDFGRSQSRDNLIVDNNSASGGFSFSSNIPLFTGFRISNQIEAGKWNLKATLADLDKIKEDVSLNIASLYLQILFNREVYKVACEQVLLSGDLVKRAEERVKAGGAPESEIYETRSTLSGHESEQTKTLSTLKLSLIDLAQMLELEDISAFDVADPEIDSLLLAGMFSLSDPDEVFGIAIKNRPSVKAAEYRLEQSKKALSVTRAGYYPTLSLGASYSNGYYHTYNAPNMSLADQLNQNSRKTLGLSLNIPIFNRFATSNQVRLAKNELYSQKLALESVRKSIRKDVQQAYYNAVAARDKFSAARKSVDASEMAFRFTREKYNAGKATTYEYNESSNRRLKSISEELQAKYEFIFRCRILDYYKGKTFAG